MYDLGNQFKFDLEKSTANTECVFKGNKYRITVLTERLLRLEYNENGMFEDYPTELIWYRNFEKPEFEVNETDKLLTIKTKYFELSYLKEKRFYGGKISPTKNLKVTILDNNKTWYYGNPEVRNFSTSVFNIDDTRDKKLKKSLYSLDGFATIDDSKSSIILENGAFKKRDNAGVDLYLFAYGKDFYFCLSDYFMVTGYPPLIPRYALGNWWDKNEFYGETDIAHLIKKFEDNNIPISLFILNKWNNNNEFLFNDKYKNPKFICEYLEAKKIKFGLSINIPKEFIPNTISYNTLKDYVVLDKNGNIPFNVFDPRTVDAFLKLLIHPLNNLGIDMYSLDNFNQNDLERLSIIKHYLYYDRLRNRDKRPIIDSRNFTYASHRYPILYMGSIEVGWDTLKKIPGFNARATNMGTCFWSYDVGGTSGGIEDNELFGRFVQLATFSPILRLGSDAGKYYKREVWKWALKPREIAIKFLNLRHSLVPYLYTEAYKYFKYGKPFIEPIYYTYPGLYDNLLYRDEYFLGSTFLISPITDKKNNLMNRVIKKIYIPKGVWYDFFTGKKFNGDRKYTAFYKDQEYPVFVKAGSIIPISLNTGNDVSVPKDMEIQVFPGANNTYSIYEDDGKSNRYLDGEYLITNVEYVYEKDRYKLTILPVAGKKGIVPEERNYRIRFKNTKPSTTVATFLSGERINNNCYKDNNDLVIDISGVKTDKQLTVVCSGKDIEIEAIRIINEDMVSIISDLPIKTIVKQKIDDIMFSDKLELKKKRIEIRKLANGKNYIERKYVDLLLKLLEYINEV